MLPLIPVMCSLELLWISYVSSAGELDRIQMTIKYTKSWPSLLLERWSNNEVRSASLSTTVKESKWNLYFSLEVILKSNQLTLIATSDGLRILAFELCWNWNGLHECIDYIVRLQSCSQHLFQTCNISEELGQITQIAGGYGIPNSKSHSLWGDLHSSRVRSARRCL